MNNPNPFVPQGSLVEQMNKKRARVKMAVLAVFSGTIILIAPVLLIQGCKRDQSSSQDTTSPDATATADTNTSPNVAAMSAGDTNVTNMAAPLASQPPMQPVAPAMTPVAQPVSTPAPTATTTYVVVPHDTLAGIAKKYGVKVKELEAANPGVVPTKLAVGKTLNIPASGSTSPTSTAMAGSSDASSDDMYVVKSGDNLTKIAHTSGTTVKALMDLNNLSSTRINAGQKLKLPVKSTAASPMETMPATTTTASNPTSGSPVMR